MSYFRIQSSKVFLAGAVFLLLARPVYAGLPDLAVSGTDISFSSTLPEPGEPLTITATVGNIGENYFVYPPFDRHDTLSGQGSDYVTVYSSISLTQSFIAGSDLYLGKVSLYIKNAGTVSDAMTVKVIKNKGLGIGPSPTNVPENIVVSQTLVSTFTSFGWQDFVFDTAPFLSAGTTYWLCAFNNVAEPDRTNAYQWWFDTGTVSNQVWGSYDQGVNWGPIAGGAKYVAYFKAYKCTDTVVACYQGNPDAGGILIGSRTIHTPVPAAMSTTVSFPWMAAASTDIYVAADRPGFIAESQENNNTAFKHIDVVAVPPAATGTLSPPDAATGVPVDAGVRIHFTEDMDAATLQQALSVAIVRDNAGLIPADCAVTGTAQYSGTTLTFSAAWKKGTTYRVTLSTAAKDLYGSGISAPITWIFTTIMDRTAANTVIDNASGTQVTLVPGAAADDYYIMIDTDPVAEQALGAKIRKASSKIQRTNGAFFSPIDGSLRRISLFTASGAPLTGSFPQGALITLSYTAAGGQVQDSAGRLVKEKTLSLYWLDEDNDLWIRIPDSTVDTQAQTVSARVNHFSVYALFGGSDTDLSHAYAYPVPWKPAAGKTETGTLAGGITFTGLGSEAVIRIYTLSGELVKVLRYQFAGGAEQQVWDGTNTGGEAVASGVYLYRIENSREHMTGKLIIVR